MKQIERVLHGKLSLKGRSWEVDCPKANVLIFEGMEEHCARYDYFAKNLNEAGYSVFALDYFGQGLNVKEDLSNCSVWPKRGFDKVLDIFGDFAKELKSKGPVYIFAHSMGSFYAQRFIQVFSGVADKVVLCGAGSKNYVLEIGHMLSQLTTFPFNRDKKSHLLNKMMFGNFNKKIKNPKTNYDWLSYNEKNVQTYIDDPLCGFGPTNGFCLEFIRGMLPIFRNHNLKKVSKKTNLFIISGSEDPVTNYGKSTLILQKNYAKLGLNSVTAKIYTPYRHEILNEDIKDTVISDILDFYNK